MEKKELTEALELHQKAIEEKIEAISKANSDEATKLKAELKELQKRSDELDIAIQKNAAMQIVKEEVVSLEQGMKNLFNSEEFKTAKKEGFPRGKNTFEVKASTADITGTVNLTQQNLSVKFNPERALAFMPYMNTGTVGQDKNRILWVEGTYTSNVGYVSEGTGQTTADAGTATEKTRALAKISAKLALTEELLEDADYVASAFRMKMQEKAMLFVDGEIYEGDGSDGVNPNHIYGIKGQSTAYSVATTGSALKIATPNIGDLVDDCILQAELSEQRGLNVLWMNPKDFARFRREKDANGQYLFVKAPNGSYTINGLNIVRSSKVSANEMLFADTSKIQLWWKRNPEVKFSQMNASDFVNDSWTAVMFLRNQVVVETPDKTALIYVADIDAALTALTLPSGN